MRKIPTVFVRDWDGDRRYVLDEVSPGCEWVIKGEGTPTRKYDGTCVWLTPDGQWWARREVKEGKLPPPAFIEIEHDAETGKTVGWEPIEQSAFAKWHAEAVREMGGSLPAGTYELIGPKINGNPENCTSHLLIAHAAAQLACCLECPSSPPGGHGQAPRDFDGLAMWLHAHPYEGVVWHHPDGRMAKIKKRDFRATASAATVTHGEQ
jgi:hypothetical protein